MAATVSDRGQAVLVIEEFYRTLFPWKPYDAAGVEYWANDLISKMNAGMTFEDAKGAIYLDFINSPEYKERQNTGGGTMPAGAHYGLSYADRELSSYDYYYYDTRAAIAYDLKTGQAYTDLAAWRAQMAATGRNGYLGGVGAPTPALYGAFAALHPELFPATTGGGGGTTTTTGGGGTTTTGGGNGADDDEPAADDGKIFGIPKKAALIGGGVLAALVMFGGGSGRGR